MTLTGLETIAVRNWQPGGGHHPLNTPLHLSSVWEAASSEQLAELFNAAPDEGFYTRFGHPTLRTAETKIAALEGAEDGLVFSSGMGAITCAILSAVSSGDHVIAHRSIFGQTIQFLGLLARSFDVDVTFVDARTPGTVRDNVRPTTRLIHIETPSNPNIDIIDIARVVEEAGPLPVYVDSTFAGPVLQNPIALGATLAIHSASKSMGGHADLLAGAVAGPADLLRGIRAMRTLLGQVLDPHACWLLLRGLQTLPLRIAAQAERAAAIAAALHDHEAVDAVFYPFLEGSPWLEVAKKQMRAGGGMLSFTLKGGLEAARRFVGELRLIAHASSLGHVYTTIEIPEELDFSAKELGGHTSESAVPPGLLRLSVGIESLDDLLGDVKRALSRAS